MNTDIDFNIMREPGFYNRVLKERETDKSEINKVGWKFVVQCPICKTPNNENKRIYKTEFGNYLKCKTCSCLYLDIISNKPNSGQYSTKTLKSIPFDPDEQKREYRKERFGNERIHLISKFNNKPLSKLSLLDIGCNTGFFIEKAKESMKEVFGLEKENILAQYAEQKTGCKIFTDFDSVNRTFDIITLFDTIEHLESPLSFLKKCSSLLNEDGLLIIFTPNYESIGFYVLGSQCNQLSPGHLVLFCKETCTFISDNLGLHSILYETAGMDCFDIVSYDRDINNIKNSVLCDNVNLFQDAINKTDCANSLRLILKKGDK
jgi:2-polyprenyl-3-methyl-5-hydroxy-6-metoxy-1,4-benzoquinol methylase